jgi:hypothetical protein
VLLGREVIRQAELSAEQFRAAPQDEANRLYAACLDDLQLLVDAVDQTLQLQDGSPTNGSHLGQDSLRRNLHKLAAVTGELLSAYRKDDVMVVADVLTYELVPLLKHMHQGLEAFLTHIQAT